MNHRLLLQAGFIFPVSAGIYALSPLGFRVAEKIKNVIRKDFDEFDVQEMTMPVIHPVSIWKQTGRFEEVGRELWKIKNWDKEDFVLAMTHEEVAGYLAQNIIQTYKDLPIYINQFQTKIRDELRPRGGMLRLREFLMQDAYSFDKTEKDLDVSYKKFYASYQRIFKKLSLNVVSVEASGDVMGRGESHEFMIISDAGGDKIAVCAKCGYKANLEILRDKTACLRCRASLEEKTSIELGHIFKLELKYSKPFNIRFKDKDGKNQFVYMGSYGIGIGRVMASIIEVHHDEKGIVWPESTSPFRVHLISLNQEKTANKLYFGLLKAGVEVLYDDRLNKTPGEKFADADLMGIPYRVVVSERTMAKNKVEVKKRDEKKMKLVSYGALVKELVR